METQIVRAMDVDTDQLHTVAKLLALSGYFDTQGPADKAVAQMAVKVLAGREMGFGPFASAQGIYLIQGKPSVSANLMASAVKNSPRYDYRVRKMDASECVLEFFERDAAGKLESIGVSSFTIQEARAAQVKNLDKFPRNMLFARALSNGVRWYCPNVFNGNAVYVPEELGAETNADNEIITVQAQPAQPAQPKPAGILPATLMRINALADELYGEARAAQEERLCQHITKGAAHRFDQLTYNEGETIVSGLENKRAQQQAEKGVDAALAQAETADAIAH